MPLVVYAITTTSKHTCIGPFALISLLVSSRSYNPHPSLPRHALPTLLAVLTSCALAPTPAPPHPAPRAPTHASSADATRQVANLLRNVDLGLDSDADDAEYLAAYANAVMLSSLMTGLIQVLTSFPTLSGSLPCLNRPSHHLKALP